MQSASKATEFLSVIVRILGLIMLLIGLYVGIKVIFEAWNLYDEPERIERFADAIDHGSNLDNVVDSLTQSVEIQTTTASTERSQPPVQASNAPRVSYFLAWFLAILLLMIIGGLATSAIRTGGQLALYDLEVKRLARQIMEEARKKDLD